MVDPEEIVRYCSLFSNLDLDSGNMFDSDFESFLTDSTSNAEQDDLICHILGK